MWHLIHWPKEDKPTENNYILVNVRESLPPPAAAAVWFVGSAVAGCASHDIRCAEKISVPSSDKKQIHKKKEKQEVQHKVTFRGDYTSLSGMYAGVGTPFYGNGYRESIHTLTSMTRNWFGRENVHAVKTKEEAEAIVVKLDGVLEQPPEVDHKKVFLNSVKGTVGKHKNHGRLFYAAWNSELDRNTITPETMARWFGTLRKEGYRVKCTKTIFRNSNHPGRKLPNVVLQVLVEKL